MMMLTLTKENTIEFYTLNVLYEINKSKDKIFLFEKKYKKTFSEFENEIKNSEENFEKWDDFLEWKANINSLKYLKSQKEEIYNGNFKIA